MTPSTRPHAPVLYVGAALLAVYLIWGSTYLAIRFAIETLPPFLFASLRFLIAGSALFFWRRARGERAAALEWRSAAIVGLFLLVGGNGSVVWAEQRVPSGLTTVLIATVPLWMVLIDWLRPGGRFPRLLPLAGLLVGFLGIDLLVGREGLGGGGPVDPLGALVIVSGAFMWAAGSLYGRGARLPLSPLLGTGIEMLASGAGLLLLARLAGDWGRLNLSHISPKSLSAVAYLVVFGSWVAFSAYVWLLRAAPTPLVSTYAYVNPVVAILLGSALAGEPLTPRTVLAAAIILSSVVLTTSGPRTFLWRTVVKRL
jgi:drug/metabolite transporter (DMT)-like permease